MTLAIGDTGAHFSLSHFISEHASQSIMSTTNPQSSSVSRAVETTLSLFHDDEVARGKTEELSSCHVFSYREDFDYLWGIGGYENESVVEDARASEQEVSIVLVNDGIPDSPEQLAGPSLNIRDRITAYDWVAHFFLSVLDGDDAPSVRLFVLDVTSQASGDSFASQRLQSLLPLMPWIRVYRLFDDRTDLQSRLGHFRVGFGNLAADVVGNDVYPLSSVDEDTNENAETLIREAWVNNLTRPEGRHDVSNLVAPLVLAEGLGKGKEIVRDDLRRAALAELLQTLGVLQRQSEVEDPVQSPLETEMVENNIFGQFDHVRFLLLDDQAALGYHDILASLLFGDNAVREEVGREGELKSVSPNESGSLRSITDPRPVMEALFEVTGLSGDSQKEVEWSQPRVLDSLAVGEDEDDGEFDVLLLDLRLFGAESDSDQDEFLSRLVEFYEQSGAERIDDEQLERAVESARQHVEDNEEAGDAAELMHLALLPLLLSYVDPSLPIVLFSSTRQEAVIEALAHRPNIITSFHKPVVSGYGEEMSLRDHAKSLSHAMADALRLHEARCVWRRIEKAEWGTNPVFSVSGPDGTNYVYNYDGDRSKLDEYIEKQRHKTGYAGRKEPIIKESSLREIFCEYYKRYIIDEIYLEFMAVPSRFIEGCLTPQKFVDNPEIKITHFRLPKKLDSFNYIREITHTIRNRVVHGNTSIEGSGDRGQARISAILVFLALLDFVTRDGSVESFRIDIGLLNHFLRSKYDHLSDMDYSEFRPRSLINDSKVSWIDVLAFVSSYHSEQALEKGAKVHHYTATAIRRISNSVLQDCSLPKPHPEPESVDSEKLITGIVKFISTNDKGNKYGFIKNKPNVKDIYINSNEMSEVDISEGSIVKYNVDRGEGGMSARNIQVIHE